MQYIFPLGFLRNDLNCFSKKYWSLNGTLRIGGIVLSGSIAEPLMYIDDVAKRKDAPVIYWNKMKDDE